MQGLEVRTHLWTKMFWFLRNKCTWSHGQKAQAPGLWLLDPLNPLDFHSHESRQNAGKIPYSFLCFEMKGEAQTNTTTTTTTQQQQQKQWYNLRNSISSFIKLEMVPSWCSRCPLHPEVCDSQNPFPTLIGFLQSPIVWPFWVGGWQVTEGII